MSDGAGQGHNWTGFALWALAGLTASLTIIAGFSIGIFIAPLAAASIVLAGRRSATPSPAGLLLGVGLAFAMIGLINIDELSCPESGERIRYGGRLIESCGSFDPRPWLILGGVLVAGSAISERLWPTS